MRPSVPIIAALLALWSPASWALTQDNFLVRATSDLVELCSAPPSDQMRVAAIHFCEGFVVGANQYYMAERAGSGSPPLFCLPTPPPTRDEATAMFVSWARNNPQYMSERPVDSLMRFAVATWPCRK